jgi:hypothetical protein
MMSRGIKRSVELRRKSLIMITKRRVGKDQATVRRFRR